MIPVTFTYLKKEYKGYLSPVTGSGGVFHLMIDKRYRGQLIHTDKWEFYSNDRMFEELAEYFGQVVVAWYG